MADNKAEKTIYADQALELMMRDTLGGMEEFAAAFGYQPWPGCFEIISIEPPESDPTDAFPETVVWLKTGTTH
jgi:hypothetical protein